MATRSPTRTRADPSPSSTTSPHTSWPMKVSLVSRPRRSRLTVWTSLPQMPALRVLTTAVPGLARGSGICSTKTASVLLALTARMDPLPRLRGLRLVAPPLPVFAPRDRPSRLAAWRATGTTGSAPPTDPAAALWRVRRRVLLQPELPGGERHSRATMIRPRTTQHMDECPVTVIVNIDVGRPVDRGGEA